VAGFCEYGDEPSDSGATELVFNWKEFGRKRSWLNLKVLSLHFPGGTDENHEELRSG
jgi:hypothetical protein